MLIIVAVLFGYGRLALHLIRKKLRRRSFPAGSDKVPCLVRRHRQDGITLGVC